MLLVASSTKAQGIEEITFRSIDGLEVTADLFETGNRSDPILFLFHQSASSRGEFRTTAPTFVDNGFNVMAVDLRWGHEDFWNFIPNKTAERYGTKAIMDEVDAGNRDRLWPTIMDSYLDMVSALDWAYMNDFTGKRLVAGSSASALLVFQVPQHRDIDGILAFSPGEYHDDDSTLVQTWASDLSVPVYIAAGVDEEAMTRPIFEAVSTASKTHYQAEVGPHGASMLIQDERNMDSTLHFLRAFQPSEEIELTTSDGISVFGNWFETDPSAPTMMLFHQGGSNARAEYDMHVPRFLHAGYNVLMTDQRRGGTRLGGQNRTVSEAGDATYSYCDAYPDLVAALRFAESRSNGPIVALGSSYSAALVMKLAADEASIDATLAFSPASGAPMDGCQPLDSARLLESPLMVFRPPAELQLASVANQWAAFSDLGIPGFIPLSGVHGASMLNPDRVGASVEPTWDALWEFLKDITPSGR